MSASAALQFFRERTDLSALQDKELQDLSVMSEAAECKMRDITEVMLGMGCLISSDSSLDHARAGNFQDGDEVPTMLFFLAEAMQAQIETMNIAVNAERVLSRRRERGVSHAAH